MPDSLTLAKKIRTDREVTGAAVVSVGMSVPDTVVTNEELAAHFEDEGVTPELIVDRTGIRERRVAAPGEDMMTFAEQASLQAIDRARLEPDDIDLILFATTTYTEIMPGAAPVLADRIGARRPGAIDVGAACNGFISALDLATPQIEMGRAQNVLVVGADLMRSILDEDDRKTSLVFADGAGAAVVTAVPGDTRIATFARGSDGSLCDLITASQIHRKIVMNGRETFKAAVAHLSEVTLEAIREAGLEPEDIDLYVYHQANRKILHAVGEEIGLPLERVVDCIEYYGNTSAATVPIALAHAYDSGDLRPGGKVLMGAVGGGLLWGAAVVEWGHPEDE